MPYHRGVDVDFDRLLTRRLLIRRFIPSDAPSFARYRSIPEVARYQSWDAPYPLEQARPSSAGSRTRIPTSPANGSSSRSRPGTSRTA